MADYIPREAAIDAIEGINWYKYNDEGRLVQGGTSHDKMFLPYKAVEGSLKAIPAADVRPVVTCGECEYCIKKDEHELWCNGFCNPARLVRKDDFCSRGKRGRSKKRKKGMARNVY